MTTPEQPSFTPEEFQRVKESGEKTYKAIGEIYCPYFKEKIVFNTLGLEHLKFKGWGRARIQEDQYTRFRLIDLAPKVVSISHTIQGISEIQEFVRRQRNSRWEQAVLNVSYFEFVAVMGKFRVRVIIRQVDGGQKHFWSIIPFWKMTPDKAKRILHSGNPATD